MFYLKILAVISFFIFLTSCGSKVEKETETNDGFGQYKSSHFNLPYKIIANTNLDLIPDMVGDNTSFLWRDYADFPLKATLAYAVKEYISHLGKIGVNVDFEEYKGRIKNEVPAIFLLSTKDKETKQFFINNNLLFDTKLIGNEGYIILPIGKNLVVISNSRIGLLYGIYELLKKIGFSWLSPHTSSTPDALLKTISLPIIEKPNTKLRGFWTYGKFNKKGVDEVVSNNYLIWMARNKFNIVGSISSSSVNHLLGIKNWIGGHHLIKESLDSSTVFQDHPDWYAEVNGVRRAIPQGATESYFNPSFGNSEMGAFVVNKILDRLVGGDLKTASIINLWPADSRSGKLWDESQLAKEIGNNSDNLLFFYYIVSKRLSTAYLNGEINRLVTVAGISYYQTWDAPTNMKVVDKLSLLPNYIHLFYTNERNFSNHLLFDVDNNEENKKIINNVKNWMDKAPNIKYGFVEYYNYSIYAGVALNDSAYVAENLKFFQKNGGNLFSYMHPTINTIGSRRLLNYFISELSWNSYELNSNRFVAKDKEIVSSKYYSLFYDNAGSVSQIYRKVSNAISNVSQMMKMCSLTLFSDQYWSPRPYTDEEIVLQLEKCKQGGVKTLLSPPYNDTIRTTFVGLDESVSILKNAKIEWNLILDNMELGKEVFKEDIQWFESSYRRYRLLQNTISYKIYLLLNNLTKEKTNYYRQVILTDIEFLDKSPTTSATISAVNQRSFLSHYKKIIDN